MVRRACRARAGRASGFALVDVIIAAVLLGVALAVIIGLIGRGVGAQADAERLADAAALADEQLNLVLARGPDDYAQRFGTSGQCDPPFEQFSYELTIAGGSDSTPYSVTATISWMSGSRAQSLSIQTLMAARPGMTRTRTGVRRRRRRARSEQAADIERG